MKRALKLLFIALILPISGCVLARNEAIISDVMEYRDKATCVLQLTLRSGQEIQSRRMSNKECSDYQKGDIVWLHKDGRVEKIQK